MIPRTYYRVLFISSIFMGLHSLLATLGNERHLGTIALGRKNWLLTIRYLSMCA